MRNSVHVVGPRSGADLSKWADRRSEEVEIGDLGGVLPRRVRGPAKEEFGGQMTAMMVLVVIAAVVVILAVVVGIGARSVTWSRNVMGIVATYLRPQSCPDLLDRLSADSAEKPAIQPAEDGPDDAPPIHGEL